MQTLQIKTDPLVETVFENYPVHVRKSIEHLRDLILETAHETEEITEIEETLKWGEPSYLTKQGSTLRIDWKEKKPDQYSMFFKCTSKLVPSFKSSFPDDLFSFEGNRAIVFRFEEKVPAVALKKCIRAALLYHKVKNILIWAL
jgi:hypothetical protein